MINHKQTLIIRLLVLLSTFFSLMILPIQAQSVFRIGVIDEEDGAITKGTRLAVNQINNSGGITGSEGTIYNLDVVVASPENLQVAVANMNQAGVIAVIGPETTEQILSSITVLQQLNVPIFTPAIGDTVLLQDNTNRIFRSRAQEVTQGRALADYLANVLNLRTITTVQLDVESTASIIGLSTALSGYSITLNNVIYDQSINTIENIIASIIQTQPSAVGIYGQPDLAVQVFNRLKSSGYTGRIIYNQATHPNFVNLVPTNQLSGVINSTTWSYSSRDESSRNFVADYVATFGSVPNAITAASYDAVQLIAEATSRPGVLANNLVAITDFQGVQGVLSPSRLSQGEISTNVTVSQLNQFGSPNVAARYINNTRIPDDSPQSVIQTPTPIPSATPDGFTAIIQSAVQNIRGGPSTDYDILGQLPKDTQVRVIGATVDFTWLVIDYRGQQGWLATYLVETFGDRNNVPIIQPPPKPTPLPATAVPTAAPAPDLVIVSASPNRITLGELFTVNVGVLNQGSLPAGPFGVATSFEPGGVYAGVNLNSLGGGQQTTVQFQQTITGDTGPQSIKIIADLNSQVDEGVNGEANNSNYTYTYIADKAVKNSGTIPIVPGGLLDLDGTGTDDIKWTGASLDIDGATGMYLISGYNSINDIHADVIDKSLATTPSLVSGLLPNAMIGIETSDGKKGVIHVTSVTAGGSITLNYRAYK
jgi:branched-chain amino acid transport system substrate-binding protein